MNLLQVSKIKDGTVIDHIQSDLTFRLLKLLDLKEWKNVVSVSFNLKSEKLGKKGLIKIENKELTKNQLEKIAIIAPSCTVNLISDYKVANKYKLEIPEIIHGVIKCSNPNCITNHEPSALTRFKKLKESPIVIHCTYCEKEMVEADITVHD